MQYDSIQEQLSLGKRPVSSRNDSSDDIQIISGPVQQVAVLSTKLQQLNKLRSDFILTELPQSNEIYAPIKKSSLDIKKAPLVDVFWTRKGYIAWLSNEGQAEINREIEEHGKNKVVGKRMRCLVHLDGTPFTSGQAEEIRDRCMELIVTLKQCAPDLLKDSWRAMEIGERTLVKHLYKQLKFEFPVLGYCEDDWKLHNLFINFYKQWAGIQTASDNVIVIEDPEEDVKPPPKKIKVITSL